MYRYVEHKRRRIAWSIIVTRLGDERSEVSVPMRKDVFLFFKLLAQLSGLHSSYTMDNGVLYPEKSGLGVMFNSYLYIALRLLMNRAKPLLTLHAFMALRGIALPLPLPLFARSGHQWRCCVGNHKTLLAACYRNSLFKNESDVVFIVTIKQFALLLHRYTQSYPSFSAAFIDPSLKVAW
jgi:hypothetical protein